MAAGVLGPAVLVLAVSTVSCSQGSFADRMDLGVCDPGGAGFTTTIDNPYFPLLVGHEVVLEGAEAGGDLLVRITVLDRTEDVAGVQTRVVREYEAKDGTVLEVSHNFFAQAVDGTVCYFGEDVDIYDASGAIVSHGGAWRADGETNVPGIYMPASLEVGQAFQQEIAPGIAEDEAKVIALGRVTEVPGGTFEDTATLLDRNPLDGSQGEKVYARGIGVIVDGPAEMTSYSTP
ncbi:MAG: hypothetical protein WD096_10670 [Actinomycetota bacterium]